MPRVSPDRPRPRRFRQVTFSNVLRRREDPDWQVLAIIDAPPWHMAGARTGANVSSVPRSLEYTSAYFFTMHTKNAQSLQVVAETLGELPRLGGSWRVRRSLSPTGQIRVGRA
jgi:hypothetical protein